ADRNQGEDDRHGGEGPTPVRGLANLDLNSCRAGGFYRHFRLGDNLDVLCQAVACARDGEDGAVVLRAFAERLAQHEDVPGEVALLDKRVGPDGFHQVVFADGFVLVLHEDEQDLEGLPGERDRLAIAEQNLAFRIEAKGAEVIEPGGLLLVPNGHSGADLADGVWILARGKGVPAGPSIIEKRRFQKISSAL